MPPVTVVIPCYNAAPWIGEALRSVALQGGDVEVVVVDDGSTDDSAAVARAAYPGATIIATPHAGASAARNAGTRAAHGQFIQYLDADDMLAAGKLAVQRRALEESAADVAYGDWQYLVTRGAHTHQGRVVARTLDDPEIQLFTWFWCPPAAYLFRREMVQRVGGFREDLPVIQDARFALDCALQGGRFVYCPGVMAYYRQHGADTVSRRDPGAFVRDCLHNALDVEQRWREKGLDASRRAALRQVYAYAARQSFRVDPGTFEKAYAALLRIDPQYLPDRPRILRWLSRCAGYRRAEAIAFRYRQVKPRWWRRPHEDH